MSDDPTLDPGLESRSGRWMRYADAYGLGAEVIGLYIRDHPELEERLTLPLAFLWRHHLELRLKQLTLSAGNLIGEPYVVPNHHDLLRLRNDLLATVDHAIIEVGARGEAERRRELRDRLTAVSRWDPSSLIFRYPEDTRGSGHTPNINSAELEAEMSRASAMLDGLEAALIAFRDGTQDGVHFF